ncbi:MAG: hypothetical protein KC561_13350 [Myxococcales bacterium]|nr:hypothetical protein [Myxococcales bacterium]
MTMKNAAAVIASLMLLAAQSARAQEADGPVYPVDMTQVQTFAEDDLLLRPILWNIESTFMVTCTVAEVEAIATYTSDEPGYIPNPRARVTFSCGARTHWTVTVEGVVGTDAFWPEVAQMEPVGPVNASLLGTYTRNLRTSSRTGIETREFLGCDDMDDAWVCGMWTVTWKSCQTPDGTSYTCEVRWAGPTC